MKNLQSLHIQELNIKEIQEINGGCVPGFRCPGEALKDLAEGIGSAVSSWFSGFRSSKR